MPLKILISKTSSIAVPPVIILFLIAVFVPPRRRMRGMVVRRWRYGSARLLDYSERILDSAPCLSNPSAHPQYSMPVL
jgi:hypothetical protein